MTIRIWTFLLAVLLMAGCTGKQQATSGIYLLAGTYTGKESKGIYIFRLDTLTGESTATGMAEIPNPSFLALSPDERFVYAVSENNDESDAVSAFAFDKETGTLALVNSRPTQGKAPCNIAINSRRTHAVTANYGGGSISVFPIQPDGSLDAASQVITFQGSGPVSNRQASPHLHCIAYSPDGKHLYATDLGTDRIHRFEVCEPDTEYLGAAHPDAISIEPGSGPRHLTFSPDGRYAYLINELSGTVTVLRNEKGTLEPIQTIEADPQKAGGSADIRITPDGRYLYASNRLKGDGVAIFGINPENGRLTHLGYQPTGAHPRNINITPNGRFLLVACRDKNAIELYRINPQTGLLTNIQKDIPLSMPVCLVFASN